MADQNYLVTARKYRPLLFGEVVAQEHVVETLKNAIRLDRLAHAYLFTGPRGVGKTTAARVLAKAINCTTPLEDREDRAEPCRTCASCMSFEQGRNLNIIEIDAASNNKVDDARDLRDTVRIPPQGGRMKVYIVDEVHMLTTSAFNALLKTLEEPPPYVLFIFATTEPHKVLPTIQSRCQRFDFRRIAVPEIITRLREICEVEGITADDGSLMLIARKGDGALRDALSVFDQAVSLCGSNLVYDEIIRALGVVGADLYFEVTDAAALGDSTRMIRIVEQVVRSGYDLQEFLDGLAEHLRNLLVIKTVADRELIEATAQVQDKYEQESTRFSESVLLRLVHIVGETADALRNTRQPRLRLEMALLKMTSLPAALDLRTALEKIDRLLKLAGRSGFPDSPGKEPVEAAGPRPRESQAGGLTGEAAASDDSRVAPPDARRASKEAPTTPATSSKPAPTSGPAPSGPETSTIRVQFDAPAIKRPAQRTEDRVEGPDASSVEVVPSDVAVLERDEDPPQDLQAAWDALVNEMMETQIRVGSLLRHTRAVSLDEGGHLFVAVPDAFHERMLRSERQRLAQALLRHVDREVKDLHFEVSEALAETLADTQNDSFDARAALMKKCEENPAVKMLVERFGGEIVW